MTIMKTLTLAAFTALSLGVASAYAQSLTPSDSEAAYFGAHNSAATTSTNRNASQIQSGSSDLEPSGGAGAATHFDYSTLANPG
jgi:hypothetical protein